ncbi:MAG: RagB/SusD family nutrient uptake outer membrane protein [Tannerella sp.]|jgi:hypothetical protein|nr:RagB/SusD family nutrient uptake outer membrane protein [Tannerella sp.]
MKINRYTWIIALVIAMATACNDLDVPPINIVGDQDVFTSESGITAYIARLYRDLPIEDFMTNAGGMRSNPEGSAQEYTDESLNPNPRRSNLSGTDFNYYDYAPVRNMNYFLQEFPTYAGDFPQSAADAWLGELYFLRAYHYYAMVKRYGGVPIVQEVMNYTGQPVDELKRPRNTESDCIDFILSDLDEAIRLLPDASLAAGRANRFIAYGMKARVALYAASVAKYGTVQLDGVLGIPATRARDLYIIAYDAARETARGGYELYNKGGDLAANYSNIFLDRSSTENMFVKYYKYPDFAHHYELFMIPWQIRGAQNYSSRGNPTLDFIERFDDADGNPFILNTGTDDAPVYYTNRTDLFERAEPRLQGIVIFPGGEYKGTVIDVRKGIVEAGHPVTDVTSTDSFTDEYNGMTIQGASGMGYNETTSTGFYIRKYLDPSIPRAEVALDRTETPWIEMRYAEMLLVRAEAAVELQTFGDASRMDDAAGCMRAIRERAGAKRMFTAQDLTVDLVRNERRMELFFENKTFWDLKRWRTFDREFSNREMRVLWPIYVYDQQKYYMKKTVFNEFRYTFQPVLYYQKVPEAEIQKNTLLIQNPGY